MRKLIPFLLFLTNIIVAQGSADSIIYLENRLLFFRNDSLILNVENEHWRRKENIFYKINVDSSHNIKYNIIDSNLNFAERVITKEHLNKKIPEILPGEILFYDIDNSGEKLYFVLYKDNIFSLLDFEEIDEEAHLMFINIKNNDIELVPFKIKKALFPFKIIDENHLIAKYNYNFILIDAKSGNSKLLPFSTEHQFSLSYNNILLNSLNNFYHLKVDSHLNYKVLYESKFRSSLLFSRWLNEIMDLTYNHKTLFYDMDKKKEIIFYFYDTENLSINKIFSIQKLPKYKAIWPLSLNIDKKGNLHIYTFNTYVEDFETLPFNQDEGTLNYHVIESNSGKIIFDEKELIYPKRIRIY